MRTVEPQLSDIQNIESSGMAGPDAEQVGTDDSDGRATLDGECGQCDGSAGRVPVTKRRGKRNSKTATIRNMIDLARGLGIWHHVGSFIALNDEHQELDRWWFRWPSLAATPPSHPPVPAFRTRSFGLAS